MAGIQREELASSVEITPKEVLAYERGDARIGAATLFTVAAILKQPIGFFYEGLVSDGQ
jgi:transcriptional regulator with XRE-family HTH domain